MRMRVAVIAIVALAASSAITPSIGQNRVDIVDIYQRFVASRVAALGCNATDTATEQKFLANLTTVTIRAAMAIKERSPGLTDAQLTTKMGEAQNYIQRAVSGEITKSGCNSPRIQQLLALYKMHSEMSF